MGGRVGLSAAVEEQLKPAMLERAISAGGVPKCVQAYLDAEQAGLPCVEARCAACGHWQLDEVAQVVSGLPRKCHKCGKRMWVSSPALGAAANPLA